MTVLQDKAVLIANGRPVASGHADGYIVEPRPNRHNEADKGSWAVQFDTTKVDEADAIRAAIEARAQFQIILGASAGFTTPSECEVLGVVFESTGMGDAFWRARVRGSGKPNLPSPRTDVEPAGP